MEFVVAGWCTGKQLRLDRTIRKLTCGDLEIMLVVIQLGVTSLKKTYLGEGKKGWCDLVCGAPLDDWANGGCVHVVMW